MVANEKNYEFLSYFTMNCKMLWLYKLTHPQIQLTRRQYAA